MPTVPTTTDRARRGAGHLAVRAGTAAGVTVAALVTAAVLRPDAGLPHVLPSALALVTLGVTAAGRPRTRRFVAVASGAVSLVSIAATAIWLAGPSRAGGGPWPLLHTLASMVLVALVCRWAPVAHAVVAGTLAVLAVALLGIPITGLAAASRWELVAICAFWSLAAFVGAGAGSYLRWLDAHRVRAVRHARRAQRLRLATDLHDFVAHDVSAMVVQAQAAQVLLRTDPEEAARMLQRIESDGTHALASMDGTIRVLRELEDGEDGKGGGDGGDDEGGVAGSRTASPGVAELPELVRRYAGSGTGPIGLEADPGLDAALNRQVGTTVYRVVVESLTNVRRHAGPGAAVTVTLHRSPEGVSLTVADRVPDAERASDADRVPDTERASDAGWGRRGSGGPQDTREPVARRHSGIGLSGLAERVEALGGTFTAGPLAPDGWQVRAWFPAAVAGFSDGATDRRRDGDADVNDDGVVTETQT